MSRSARNLSEAAQAVTDKMFRGKENIAEAAQTAQERRVTGKGKKIDDTKVFSFRSWIDDVDSWRMYAEVKGLKVDELGAAAMYECVKRHPISAEERKLQEALEAVRRAKK